MFEDRLFDNLMEEMMEDFGADVQTDEGSLAYNACAKLALKLEEVYADMEQIYDNMLPDKMEKDYLIRYAMERGITYNEAAYPIVKGVFSQEIEIGELLTCGDYDYEVTKKLSDFVYELTCTTAGVEANTTLGDLEPADYIDEYQGGRITEIISPGIADEDTEMFRDRVLASFESKAFCGNKADYRKFVNEINGVGGCKPRRRSEDSAFINVLIISSRFRKPSEELIEEVQELVDPERSHGEGDGMAPICHKVEIIGVTEREMNIQTHIIWEKGFSMETSESYLMEAVESYFSGLRMGWESEEDNGIIVRISQIEAKILGVDGVLDVDSTTVNGETENQILLYSEIPVRGDFHVI